MITLPAPTLPTKVIPSTQLDRLLDGLSLCAVIWLLAFGVWSGPALGASLPFPNGFMVVESLLVILLVIQAMRGRVRSPWTYPFCLPALAVLALCAVSLLLRSHFRDLPLGTEALRLWQNGEPIARGVLIFLVIAGRPRALGAAWIALLGGMLLHAGVAIAQHAMSVDRWFAESGGTWSDIWHHLTHAEVTLDHNWASAPRVSGLTSYINLTAALFAAYLPCWWLLPAHGLPRARRWRLVLLAGGMTMVAALWYTNSRGPMLAVLLAAPLLFWRLAKEWRISFVCGLLGFVATVLPSTPWWALSAFLVAVLLAFVVKRRHKRYLLPIVIGLGLAGGIQIVDAYFLKYQLGWRVAEASFAESARRKMYQDALYTITTSPWYGIGDAEIARRVIAIPNSGLHRLPVSQRNYHNQPLHWAAAEGLPAGLALSLLVCWATIWCWRHCGRRVTDPFARTVGLAGALGATIFLLCCMTDAHFWRIEGAGFFWSLLSVTAAALTMTPDRPSATT